MARKFSYPVSMRRTNGVNYYWLKSKDKRGNVTDKAVTLSKKRFRVNSMKKRSSGGAGG